MKDPDVSPTSSRFRAVILLLSISIILCSDNFQGYDAAALSSDIESRATNALRYVQKKGLNENYCFFLDYSIPSGQPRLFVWSFAEKRVIYSVYAMHGDGKGSTDIKPVFSNRPGSHCSSLGHFEVTREHGYKNKSGFRLRGMDHSNSNSYSRGIMIHSSKWVDINRWRKHIPLNSKSCMGCVTVSTKDMAYIEHLFEKEVENILLWSYYYPN